mmetsp:Transcript_2982/g.4523  ORF Transcript_2982/g.4523 Transcript_2982/m.4523 type:complete len:594 (-) Transcript_2982:264-2045(-)
MKKIPPIVELPLQKVPHAIDFIGTGTFQVSQLDVLQRRSVELNRTKESALSARGLHHRSKDFFARDVRASSAVIQQALLQGVRDPKNSNKSSFYLKSQYFQRALGYERLGQVDRAIEDYTRCIAIDNECAAAYFNRGGLLYAQGKLESAIADLDKAIEIEPSKQIYHTNRAYMHRRRGNFGEATSDTLISKNIMKSRIRNQSIKENLHKQISIVMPDEDPMIVYLRKSYSDREECSGDLRYVIEFIKSVKFFSGIASDPIVMRDCAKRIKLITFEKDDYVFYEGDIGKSFYILADGEVSIVKQARSLDGEKSKLEVLTKLFRGQTFGETALDNEDGKRSAGAIASQRTNLLCMDVADYKRIFANYRLALRNDIREILASCAIFSTWSSEDLDKLADHAVVKTYSANSVLLQKGMPVTDLYIVRRGVVKLMKEIPTPGTSNIKISEFSTPESISGMEAPGLWVLTKTWKDRIHAPAEKSNEDMMTFTVGVLGSGQVFGELAILAPEMPSPTSAVSFTNLEVYCFSSEFLLSVGARFNTHTMNTLNESINLYNPPVDKISHYYRSKYTWENRKKKILKSIVRERPKIAGKLDISG